MPHFFKKFIFVLAVILVLPICSSCRNIDKNTEYTSVELFAMDTLISIKAYGKNAEKALDAAGAEIRRIEKLFSVTDVGSEIYRLNAEKEIVASDEVADLIALSLDISAQTDGAFDISVYPFSILYGFTREEYRVPEQAELESALEYVDYKKISLQGNKIEIPIGASVDLGAIAKGYCGDRVAAILEQNGVSSAVISIGGNVRLLGSKNDNTDYTIAIRNPNGEGFIGSVDVSNCSVVTSGSYQRYFEIDGVKYHHIIDPKTGLCADSGLLSVTVICENGALADALSTAFFVAGQKSAEDYCHNHPDVCAVLVDENENVFVIGDVDFTAIS